MKFIYLIFVLCTILPAQISTKFYPFDLNTNDRFGHNVVINSNFLAISAHINNQNGSVYIYSLSNNKLKFKQKILHDSLSTNYSFGSTLSVDDTILYIGYDGGISIYRNNDSLFRLQKKIQGLTLDDFGLYFAVYNNDLLIGASQSGDLDEGAVYYYKHSSDSTWTLTQKLTPSIYERHSQFGVKIDFNDKYAVISSPLYGYQSGPFRGMVFLYELSDSGWVEKQRIFSPDSAYNQLFGVDLKLDNKRIVIGAVGNPTTNSFLGRVYIYAINDSGFAQLEDSIYASETFPGNYFGFSCKLIGDSLFVGAHGNEYKNIYDINNKWAYLYVKTTKGWEEKLKFSPGNQTTYNSFGYAVDFYNGNFLVGSHMDSEKKLYGGAAYLFQPNLSSIYDNTVNLESISLEQNFPNPFNPVTKIKFKLTKTNVVTLKVYDILGNEIIQLLNEEKSAGEHEIEFNSKGLTSGIYFYQIRSGDYMAVKKMILLK